MASLPPIEEVINLNLRLDTSAALSDPPSPTPIPCQPPSSKLVISALPLATLATYVNDIFYIENEIVMVAIMMIILMIINGDDQCESG